MPALSVSLTRMKPALLLGDKRKIGRQMFRLIRRLVFLFTGQFGSFRVGAALFARICDTLDDTALRAAKNGR